LALTATVSCGEPSENRGGDADAAAETDGMEMDAETIDADLDSEAGPDADVGQDVEAGADADSEVGTEDGEAEASCPTTGSVDEPIEDPGTIGSIVPTVTETYEIITECDGGVARGGLLEIEILLPEPASQGQLDAAIGLGAEITIFGERVRLTHLGLDGMEYARPVAGAEGDVLPLESVDDGVHRATARSIGGSSVSIRVETVAGTEVGSANLGPGQYTVLPSGRIVIMTNLRFSDIDPLRSRCHLAILEAPANVPNGGTIRNGTDTYVLSTEGDGADLSAVRLVSE